jgi:hypothetical protein
MTVFIYATMNERIHGVPIAPHPTHAEVADLYSRTGLDGTSNAADVLDAAARRWNRGEQGGRVEAATLVLGRNIDDRTLGRLPVAVSDLVHNDGDFASLLTVASQIAEVEDRG